jgi:AcrR family transcriptional regulator
MGAYTRATMSTTHTSDSRPAPRRGRPPSGGREAILAAALDLLRERGASRLTTREVAKRAGVSEGSIFYHFTDRTGLLTAVIEDGLAAVQWVHQLGGSDEGVEETLAQVAAALEAFLDRALVAMIAAQSDSGLRTSLADHLLDRDMGPHRGIQALATYLEVQQAKGTIRGDVDPQAVALYVYSACFLRVSQRQMIGETYSKQLPSRETLISTIARLLTPPDASPAAT